MDAVFRFNLQNTCPQNVPPLSMGDSKGLSYILWPPLLKEP